MTSHLTLQRYQRLHYCQSKLGRSWSQVFCIQVKVSVLKSVCRVKLKRARRVFCRKWCSESVKFPGNEMIVPRLV